MGNEYTGEGTDAQGNVIFDGSPGTSHNLPAGVSAKLLQPTSPNGNSPAFKKSILRGIASGYVAASYNTLANDLEEAGQRLYAVTEVTLDFAFPVLYSTWLGIIIVLVWRKVSPEWERWKQLALLPYLGMLADFIENTFLAVLMLLFPKEPIWLVWLSNLASLIKWIAGLASLGIILLGLGVLVVQLFCHRKM